MPLSFRSFFSSLSSCLLLSILLSFSGNVSAEKWRGQPGEFNITPPDITYYALQGDTLSSIALRFTDKVSNANLLGKRNKIANDRTIPVGSAILIPLELMPEEASEAKVVALAGNATLRKKEGADTAIAIGDILTEGSHISTGKNGFLSLALPDASRISIPSNSQVSLAKLRMTKYTKSPRTEINLQQGRIESTVTPLSANKGRFEVTSPLATAGVRGTHFRVGVNENGIANEVLTGAVAVGNKKKPNDLLIPSGKGNIISNTAIGKAVDLLPAPALSGNFQLQEKPTVQFGIAKMADAHAYRAQIALDGKAQDIVMEGRVTGENIKLDGLDDGQYFVRITAIDAIGLEGLPVTQAFTLKARPEPPFSAQPKAKLRADSVDFVWTEASDAKAYRLQVASDAAFQQLMIDQADIPTVQYHADKLANGSYFWRVATIAQKNGKMDQGPFSDPQTFHLMPPQAMNPVKDTGDNTLSFNWPSEPGQKFLVQIATDAAFSAIYLARELDQPQISIPRPEAGAYFIRVKATDADGYVGAFSATQKVTIFTRWVSGNGEPINANGGAIRPNF
ncbi:MAG: FecR domain-containing protein [Undibacterium sp.]|nr:FecR domain-containing protein [Undibacterium sp.]